ncbi:DUF4154 domain-containing protein [Exilibacterium tricleocarpae]|uniref:Sensory/regulatory protein RpfC n=1 Tax=Exilibacterium tricleocarpae TaxID=2591008 RepID=A0A545TLQ3_9GAMM|nr:YfiR/HmsC family protein [Exilibacterium tricleocarpae]TQV78106.1 DUF4154 domain-containing protein [Exilibacterium tricleocarpae]
MIKIIRRWSIYGLLLALAAAAATEEAISVEAGKIAFIHKILVNITWPGEEDFEYFSIGVYDRGRDFSRMMKRQLADFEVRGKPIRVISVRSLASARDLQALVVGPAYNRELVDIARRLRKSETLLITDGADDKRNVMINFFQPTPERLSFELNRSSILYEGLALSKDITLFGGTELDVAIIHKETEAELAEVMALAEERRRELLEQEVLISRQRQTMAQQEAEIESQNREIDSQQLAIARQTQELADGKQELDRLENSINQITESLTRKEGELAERASVLASQEANIEQYSTQIQRTLNRLNVMRDEVTAREARILEKDVILEKQGNIIRNQKVTLGAATAALLLVLTLITIIFRSYREKNRVNKELVEMAKAKSLFLSTMSHEIRTPLNGVLGMVDLLKDTPISEQQRHYLNTIHTSGEMLLSVINDILDYSKIEAGKMAIEEVAFDLEKLVFGCAAIFTLRETEDLEFMVDVPPAVPTQLRGDPTRIRQILLNLLSNAFKFTDSGEIQVSVKTSGNAEEGRWYHLFVSDTGVGMSQEQQESIFDSFVQADSSITRRYGGSGLGLAISQRLAGLMGGHMEVTSTLDKGSVFTLTLPLVEAGGAAAAAGANSTLAGRHLLIADARPHRCRALAEHARAWSMNVRTADSIAAVHRSIAAQQPDFVLLAEQLERMAGIKLARDLKTLQPDGRILLMTHATAAPSGIELTACNVVATVEMPVAPSLLRQTLAGAVAQAQAENPPRTEPAPAVAAGGNGADDAATWRVLVAEDNPVNQMVIKGFLAREGITTEIANNGLEAVEHYRDQCARVASGAPYDLIFMDCEMPELDGLSATRQIRDIETRQARGHAVIVALTAHAMAEQRQAAFAAGMDEHLAKPLKPEKLREVLAKYLRPVNTS